MSVATGGEHRLVEALERLRLALDEEDGLRDRVEAIRRAFDDSSEATASTWIRQARALSDWSVLASEVLSRPPARTDPVRLSAWEELAQRCDVAIAKIRRRNEGAWLASWLLDPVRQDGQLLCDSEALLVACRDILRRDSEPLSSEIDWSGVRQHTEEVSQEFDVAQTGSTRWVPGLLLRLWRAGVIDLESMRDLEIGDGVEGESGSSGEERERIRLARGILASLPGKRFSSALLEPLRRELAALFGPDTTLELRLEPNGLRDRFWQIREAVDRAEEGVVRPALLVRRSGEERWVCLSRGEWLQQPAPSPLVTALRRLARSVQRVPAADPTLPQLCEQLEQCWPPGGTSVAEWWRTAPESSRMLVWELVQRLHLLCIDQPDQQGPVYLLYKALRDERFRLLPGVTVGVVAGSDEALTPTGWLVYESKCNLPRETMTAGPVLVGPDERAFAPVVWLRLLPTTEPRPFVRCLAEVGMRLRQSPFAEDAAFVHVVNEQSWAATNGGAGDVARCRTLFLHAYHAWRERPIEQREAYLEVLRRIRRCLCEELGQKVQPALDDQMQVRVDVLPAETIRTLVAEGPGEVGECWVLRFGDQECPPEVAVRISAELARWLEMPAPPSSDSGRPLAQLHEKARAEVFQSAKRFEEHRTGWRRKFREMVEGQPGPRWLNQFGRAAEAEARTGTVGWALPWLELLCEEQFLLGFYPRPTTAGLCWPEGESHGKDVRGEYSEEPAGSVLSVQRFAETADHAQCVLSLGPREAWPLLGQIDQLSAELRDDGHEEIVEKLHALRSGLERERLEGIESTAARYQKEVEHLLEAIGLADLSLSKLAPLLPLLAEIVEQLGGCLRPRSFEELDRDEAVQIDCEKWVYSQEPHSQIIALQIGVEWPSGERRGCAITRSVGPAPDGYDDLRALLVGEHSAVVAMATRLEAMATTASKELVDFFSCLFEEFYRPGGVRSVLDTESAEKASTALARLVRSQDFSLVEPGKGEPFQANWCGKTESGEEVNDSDSRVRAVLRPGLLQGDHLVLAPTVVVTKEGR